MLQIVLFIICLVCYNIKANIWLIKYLCADSGHILFRCPIKIYIFSKLKIYLFILYSLLFYFLSNQYTR